MLKFPNLLLVLLVAVVLSAYSGAYAEDAAYPYFNKLREAAATGKPYPGVPGKGKVLAFANVYGTIPFCIAVEEDIVRQAELAGFDMDKFINMDNQYNSVVAIKNADIILSKKPDVFIEFQADSKVNSMIAIKYRHAGIPILAIDIPIPGAPFMGIDNWGVAMTAGVTMSNIIRERWGGWDDVDLVVLLQVPAGGEVNILRSEGVAAALAEEFSGIDVEKKIVRIDGGMGQTEEAKQAMDDVLAAHPDAKRIAFTAVNDQCLAGTIAAIQSAGRWVEEDMIGITLGVDELGQSLIRDKLAAAGIAYFPENYGQYCIPAAVALMNNEPVPPYIYMTNEVITSENIDDYYPQD